MSLTKRFLEEVSIKHGFEGEINEEVLDLAFEELTGRKRAHSSNDTEDSQDEPEQDTKS